MIFKKQGGITHGDYWWIYITLVIPALLWRNNIWSVQKLAIYMEIQATDVAITLFMEFLDAQDFFSSEICLGICWPG